MNKVVHGYPFTFGLEKPADIEVKINIFVIQAHERGCMA